MRRTLSRVLIGVVVAVALLFPVGALFLALLTPGIDLTSALRQPPSFHGFVALTSGSNESRMLWRAIAWSSVYSIVVGASVAVALMMILPSAAIPALRSLRDRCDYLFALSVMPATYFLTPLSIVIVALVAQPTNPARAFLVLASEFLLLTPLVVWIAVRLYGNNVAELMRQAALDGLTPFAALLMLGIQLRRELLAMSLVSAALSWGNYSVPLYLANADTKSGALAVAALSSHLGTDWALVGAGASLLTLPAVLSGVAAAVLLDRRSRG